MELDERDSLVIEDGIYHGVYNFGPTDPSEERKCENRHGIISPIKLPDNMMGLL